MWETPRLAFPQVLQKGGHWKNVSHGASHPLGRGKRRGRTPDPGRHVPVEHWFFNKSGDGQYIQKLKEGEFTYETYLDLVDDPHK